MLILQPGLMANMEDGHLLASLRAEPSIIRTAVELDLIERMERLLDEKEELLELAEEFSFAGADLRPVCESHPAPFMEVAKMLALLNDAEIMDADELKALIDLKPKG